MMGLRRNQPESNDPGFYTSGWPSRWGLVIVMCITIALTCGCHTSRQSASEKATVRPLIELKSRTRGKLYFCNVSLSLENSHDFPVWFLLAFQGNQTLRRDRLFPVGTWEGRPFEAQSYDDRAGRAVLVSWFGENAFYAVLLPPRGTLQFKDYVIEAIHPVEFYDICEVRNLSVNGELPLEKWFPFDVHSDSHSTISSGLNSGKSVSLDFVAERAGTEYPTVTVRSVNAELLHCFTIPISAK